MSGIAFAPNLETYQSSLTMPFVVASGGKSPEATPLDHTLGGIRKKGRHVVVKTTSGDALEDEVFATARSAISRFFFPT